MLLFIVHTEDVMDYEIITNEIKIFTSKNKALDYLQQRIIEFDKVWNKQVGKENYIYEYYCDDARFYVDEEFNKNHTELWINTQDIQVN